MGLWLGACLILMMPCALPQDEAPAKIGERVADQTFRHLTLHDGRQRLSELYGQPVLLAGWRRHIGEGLHAAWLANEFARKYRKDGLVVILQDRKGMSGKPIWLLDVDFWIRFAGEPVWLSDGKPMQGRGPHIERNASAEDERSLVLIGVDGRLVLEGRVESASNKGKDSARSRFKKAIATELARRRKGWGDHATERKVRALLFGKGNLAAALSALARPGDLKHARVDALRREVEQRFTCLCKTITFHLDSGAYVTAQRELAALARAVRGDSPFEKRIVTLRERLDAPGGKKALRSDKRLIRILRPVAERRFRDIDLDLLRALHAFIAKHPDSPVTVRAQWFQPLVRRMVRILNRIPADEMDARLRRK